MDERQRLRNRYLEAKRAEAERTLADAASNIPDFLKYGIPAAGSAIFDTARKIKHYGDTTSQAKFQSDVGNLASGFGNAAVGYVADRFKHPSKIGSDVYGMTPLAGIQSAIDESAKAAAMKRHGDVSGSRAAQAAVAMAALGMVPGLGKAEGRNLAKMAGRSKYGELRGMIDQSGELHFWDAADAIHSEGAAQRGIPYSEDARVQVHTEDGVPVLRFSDKLDPRKVPGISRHLNDPNVYFDGGSSGVIPGPEYRSLLEQGLALKDTEVTALASKYGLPAYTTDLTPDQIAAKKAEFLTDNHASVPERFFHGTTAGDIETFRPKIRKNEQLGFGTHLSEDPAFASRYASDPLVARKGGAPTVYPLHASIKNPLIADQIVKEGSPEFDLAKKLAGSKLIAMKDENGIPSVYLQNAIDATSPERAERILRESGYDAVRYNARIMERGIGGGRTTGESTSWTVLDPEKQLRSAIAINKARGGLVMKYGD